MAHISQDIAKFNSIKKQLVEEFPDLEEDQECLSDTLEGLTNLDQVLVELALSINKDKDQAASLKALISRLNDRKNRIENRAEKTRDIILHAMLDTGLKKITDPITISVSDTKGAVIITNEDEIPDDLLNIKTSPNKKAIKEILDIGETVPGATLSNSKPCVRITI
jgi:uncharacterized coiled-coil protein SlyX